MRRRQPGSNNQGDLHITNIGIGWPGFEQCPGSLEKVISVVVGKTGSYTQPPLAGPTQRLGIGERPGRVGRPVVAVGGGG